MDLVQIFDRFAVAIINRDVDLYMTFIADDAEFTFPDGQKLIGAPQIFDVQARFFATSPMMPTLSRLFVQDTSLACEILIHDRRSPFERVCAWIDFNSDEKIFRQTIYGLNKLGPDVQPMWIDSVALH